MSGVLKSPKKSEAAIAWEAISKAMDDGLEDLIALNYEEVEQVNDIPLDIDWPKILMLERQGLYRGISLRRGGRLLGYRSFQTATGLRHRRSLWAFNDAMYIDPAERKGLLAVRFVNESDALLKSIGVEVVIQGDRKPFNSTSEKRRATFSALLQRFCGYRPVETVLSKRL